MSRGPGMPITCPKCGKKIRTKPELAGKRIRCPSPACAALIQVPGLAAPHQVSKTGTRQCGTPEPIPLDKVGPIYLIFQLPEPPPDEHTAEFGAPVASVMLVSNVFHELQVGSSEISQELLKRIRTRFTDDAQRAAVETVRDLRRQIPGVSCYVQPMAFVPHKQIRPLLDAGIDTVYASVVVAVEDGAGRTVTTPDNLVFVNAAAPEQEEKKPHLGLLGLLWPFGRGRRLEALVRENWGARPWQGMASFFNQAKQRGALRKLARRVMSRSNMREVRVPVLLIAPTLGSSGPPYYGEVRLILPDDHDASVAVGASLNYGAPRIEDSGICTSSGEGTFPNFDAALSWLKEKEGAIWRRNMRAIPK